MTLIKYMVWVDTGRLSLQLDEMESEKSGYLGQE